MLSQEFPTLLWLVITIACHPEQSEGAMHHPTTGRDLWIQNLQDGSESPLPINTVYQEYEAKISPDGRWIAYVTDAFRRDELWVGLAPKNETSG